VLEELVKIMLQSGKSGLDLALYTLLFARSAGDEGIPAADFAPVSEKGRKSTTLNLMILGGHCRRSRGNTDPRDFASADFLINLY